MAVHVIDKKAINIPIVDFNSCQKIWEACTDKLSSSFGNFLICEWHRNRSKINTYQQASNRHHFFYATQLKQNYKKNQHQPRDLLCFIFRNLFPCRHVIKFISIGSHPSNSKMLIPCDFCLQISILSDTLNTLDVQLSQNYAYNVCTF